MTPEQYRKLALGLPEAVEAEHMNHPDFRVGGKIFATLWPADRWGMVKLTVEQQAEFSQAEPEVFSPIPGGWGRNGATKVTLKHATVASVQKALVAAWRNTAPRRLLTQHDSSDAG